ncbi:gas vesicle protein [Kribbella sp. CA-253562]|uniref:gas vesicle protein n=1 Tax=Kribbella sp. CA-253562 TaxID=3239942 RepID=UPI003D8E0DAA
MSLQSPAAPAASQPSSQPVALVDLLDRLLGKGVVISGDVVISLADVELVRIQLSAVIQSVRAELEQS